MMAPAFYSKEIPVQVIKTVASQKTGIEELYLAIQAHLAHPKVNDKRLWLLAEKAFYLIQNKRMADIDKADLKNKIDAGGKAFNLYKFIKDY